MATAYGSIGKKTSPKPSASFTPKGAWGSTTITTTTVVTGGGGVAVY